MARIRILDPTAAPPVSDPDPGPDAGSLRGRRVGLRTDRAWRSWEVVADDWAERLTAAGAEVVRWCAGQRIGAAGEQTAQALDRFADDVDVVVVGLGN